MGKTIPHRGEVCLSLGGRKYRLVPTYAGLSALEESLGEGLVHFVRRLSSEGYQLTDLAEIVSAVAEPEITPEAAGAAIIESGVVKVAEAITGFLVHALTGGDEGNAPAAKGT